MLENHSPSDAFGKTVRVEDMRAEDGLPCADAKRVQGRYTFSCPYPLHAGDILRRRRQA